MISGKHLTAAACALTLAGGAAACGSDGSDEPSVSDRVKSDSSASVTTAEPTAIPSSFPDIGLEFTTLPTLKGAQTDALRTYVTFMRGHSTMMRSGKVTKLLTETAAGHALQSEKDTAAYLRKHHGQYHGSLSVTVALQGSNKQVVSLNACLDGSKLTMTENGQPTKLDGEKRVAQAVSLQPVAGTWRVISNDGTGKPC